MTKPAIKLFVGSRLNTLRQQSGLTQAVLAQKLGISASYLNQIERDQRPLPDRLLEEVCRVFSVNPAYFSDVEEVRLVQALREILADPLFDAARPNFTEMLSAAQKAPALGHAVMQLYSAYRNAQEHAASLADMPTQPVLEPYEAVGDWVQTNHNYFHALDSAAEALYAKLSPKEGWLHPALIQYVQDEHNLKIVTDHALEQRGVRWKLEQKSHTLFLSQDVLAEDSLFCLAQVVGQLEQGAVMDRILRRSGPKGENARALARLYLGNYFAGALLLPYELYRNAALEMQHDIDRLHRRFGVSFEQACHRLSTFQRPGSEGIPFYFMKLDIAGNILKSFSANHFMQSRFGGPCPLWNIFRAFTTPGQVQVQLSRMTDDVVYLNVARTVRHSSMSYFDRPRQVAVVLGCDIRHAGRMIYAAGLDVADQRNAVPIGPGCRACSRDDCRHRSLPVSGRGIDAGSDERGVVPYRAAKV